MPEPVDFTEYGLDDFELLEQAIRDERTRRQIVAAGARDVHGFLSLYLNAHHPSRRAEVLALEREVVERFFADPDAPFVDVDPIPDGPEGPSI